MQIPVSTNLAETVEKKSDFQTKVIPVSKTLNNKLASRAKEELQEGNQRQMRTKILYCTQYDTFPIWLPMDYGRLGNTAYSAVRTRGHKTCTVSSYLPAAMIGSQDHKITRITRNLKAVTIYI